MSERREVILESAVAILRETGFRDLTQPKVAARAGMTQSHLTYYFPTRNDMLEAVAKTTVDRQLERWDNAGVPSTAEELIERIILVTSSVANSRALLSLILAVDSDSNVGAAITEMVAGLRERTAVAFAAIRGEGPEAAAAHASDARLLHAFWAGTAIVGLAEGQARDVEANRQAIERLVRLLLADAATEPASDESGAEVTLADSPV